MEILLYQPEIPQNTGNIVRTCNVTGTKLTLVKPLGFSTDSKMLRRAGLDYWEETDIQMIENIDDYLMKRKAPFYFLSSKVNTSYHNVTYTPDDLLIFGSETSGLPSYLHSKYASHFITIPMLPGKRCLNLSNTVSIVLYEALRQQNFLSFE